MYTNSVEEQILKHLIKNRYPKDADSREKVLKRINLRLIAMELGFWELLDDLNRAEPNEIEKLRY